MHSILAVSYHIMNGVGMQTFFKYGPEMLYIHWPFCKSKCHYCEFVAFEGHERFEEQYHRALCNEIRAFVAGRPQVAKTPIQSLFIGGGTPSLYPLRLLEEVFKTLRECFVFADEIEISLEVNPGGQTREYFSVWRDVGINRLSVGVQVLDEVILARLHRYQTNQEVEEFFLVAPTYVKNLSADLIIGLPGVDERAWQRTCQAVLRWPLSHISLYFLSVHEQTQLYYGLKKGRFVLPVEDVLLLQYSSTVDLFESYDFRQYETSNFARNDHYCQHNVGYWQRKTYKGFGLGAASFDGTHRFSNQKKLFAYFEQFATPQASESFAFFETLTDQQVFLEKIMLGLRQREGVDLQRMVYYLSASQRTRFSSVRDNLIEQGHLTKHGTNVCLTRKGLLCEDEIVVCLCNALEGTYTALAE